MATAIADAPIDYIDAEEELASEPDREQLIEEAEQRAAEQMAMLKVEDYESLVMPGMSIEKMQERQKMIETLVTSLLTKDVHFGRIPGTQETSLWLRGAIVFKTYFGFDVVFQCVSQDRDRGAADQDGIKFPFIYYCYKAVLYRNGQRLGEYEASANSYEPCFRFIWVESQKPDQETIAQMQANETGKFIKKWDEGEGRKIFKWHVRRDHPNVMALDNSIRQRAEKRALVKVIDHATSASAYLVKAEKEAQKDAQKDDSGGGNGSKGSRVKTLPQQFWDFARDKQLMAQAAPIADEVTKTKQLTWEAAIEKLKGLVPSA